MSQDNGSIGVGLPHLTLSTAWSCVIVRPILATAASHACSAPVSKETRSRSS